MLSKLMAFDYGQKRIGVATGQAITHTATPLTTVFQNASGPDWSFLQDLIQKWRPDALIVGLPIDFYDRYTAITTEARDFGQILQHKTNKPVYYMDEKLSTREAHWRLDEQTKRKTSHYKVDALAASIILESWLEQNA